MKKIIISLLFTLLLSSSVSYADATTNNKDVDMENQQAQVAETEEKAEGEITEKDTNQTDKNIKTYIYTINNVDYEFYMYKVDLSDKANYIDIKMADNKIGHLDYLHNMVADEEKEDPNSEVLAAINGGLFNTAQGRQPITSVIENGKLQYTYYKGALANFNGENEMFISRYDFEVFFAVNDLWEEPYGFRAKFINQINYDPNGVGFLNSDYDGERFDKDMIVVEVKDKKAIKVHNRIPQYISKGNFLIVSESNKAVKNIKVGDKIDFVYRAYNRNNPSEKAQVYDLRTGIGSGPVMIENGEIVIDPAKDNLLDLGIYNARPRSMVGMTKDKQAYFVVAKKIDIANFAKLGLKLNMDVALNLDGGGSSGLMIGDKYAYLQKPERAVANALLIKRQKEVPIRIMINGKERYYDTNPFAYNNRTMLPLRGILEDLECKVSWDEATQSVLFERYGKEYSVKLDSYVIYGEDQEYQMDVPLLAKNNRTNISARYLSEILGGKVEWIADKNLVEIDIDSANENIRLAKDYAAHKQYDKAKEYYEKALEIYPDNISSIDGLAHIDKELDHIDEASNKYLKILDIHDSYIPALYNLGGIYEQKNDNKKAIAMYERLVKADDTSNKNFKTLASVYEKVNDIKNALTNFEKAYELQKEDSLAYKLISLYKKELEKNNRDIDLLKKIASKYQDVNDQKLAINFYEKAFKIDKKDIFVVKNLASLYEGRDDKLALEYFEKAYDLGSKDIEIVKKLALMNRKFDNDEKTLKYFKEAYELDNKDIEVVNALANIYKEDDKIELAIEYFEKSFELNNKDVNTAKTLAVLNENEGNIEDAITYYQKTYQLSYDEAILIKFLNLNIENESYDNSIEFVKSLNGKEFLNLEVYYILAKTYVAKDELVEDEMNYDNENAYIYFKKALEPAQNSKELNEKQQEEAEKYIAEYDKLKEETENPDGEEDSEKVNTEEDIDKEPSDEESEEIDINEL